MSGELRQRAADPADGGVVADFADGGVDDLTAGGGVRDLADGGVNEQWR
jgi:hypothetical protein